MAVNLFLTTALLSITGSTAYILLKLLITDGSKFHLFVLILECCPVSLTILASPAIIF